MMLKAVSYWHSNMLQGKRGLVIAEAETLALDKAILESQNAFLHEREKEQAQLIASLKCSMAQDGTRRNENDAAELDKLYAELDLYKLRIESTEAKLITNRLLYGGELSDIFSNLEDAMERQDGVVRELKEQLAREQATRERLIEEAVEPVQIEFNLATEVLSDAFHKMVEQQAQLRATLTSEVGLWKEKAEYYSTLMGPLRHDDYTRWRHEVTMDRQGHSHSRPLSPAAAPPPQAREQCPRPRAAKKRQILEELEAERAAALADTGDQPMGLPMGPLKGF